MSQFLDYAQMLPALKELYQGQKLVDLTYKNNPFLAMVRKDEELSGKVLPLPVAFGSAAGTSASFANAQANQAPAAMAEFMITLADNYGVATITRKMALASRNDAGAFVKGMEFLVDQQYRAVTNRLASQCFRSGTGSIGQIASISTAGSSPVVVTITLADASQAVQFETNQVVVATATDGGAPSSDALTVTAVDRSAGIITLAAASSPSGTWATNAYLVTQGDSNATMKGLSAWLPITAPTTGDNFFGVDRSKDPTRLAGVRVDGRNSTLEEALIAGANAVALNDGISDICIMSFASFTALEQSLGAKVQYVSKEAAGIGFRGIAINGPNGVIEVFPDRSCPAKVAYMLESSSWTLGSMLGAPHIQQLVDAEQGNALPVANADAREIRVSAYSQLYCNAPGHNAVIQLSA
jgi:hypothetical protein